MAEVDRKMWPRWGKKIDEAEPVTGQRGDCCSWEAVQLRVRREGLSRLRSKGASNAGAEPGESAGKGLDIRAQQFSDT